MKIAYYHIDAFTDSVFGGNPAGVCPLPEWLPDDVLQNIAAEHNLPETAFFVRGKHGWELKWFTPETEIDLCGHATLASAFVIFSCLDPSLDRVEFSTMSGTLEVSKAGGLLSMVFPSRPGAPCPVPAGIDAAIGMKPSEAYKSRDYLLVCGDEAAVRKIQPDFTALAKVDAFGVIVTAPGDSCDFVSRYFAPGAGIPEDPVTGSSHCTLIPYWSKRLGKRELSARQVSKRGGALSCADLGDRVRISGKAVSYMSGEITVR